MPTDDRPAVTPETTARAICAEIEARMRAMGVVTTAHYETGLGLIADAIRGERERAEAAERERDKLLEGLVSETWRTPARTMANVDDSGVYEHAWTWRYGAMGDSESSKAEAIAAVRRAAGLRPAREGSDA